MSFISFHNLFPKRKQHITAVWRNGGFSASYDSFVVGSSVVLRLNFCAKIRHYSKPQNAIRLVCLQKEPAVAGFFYAVGFLMVLPAWSKREDQRVKCRINDRIAAAKQ